ncbi:MAG: hypothetical protein PHN60_01050 [Candidatus Gracilibacteria bacterium]|nr:hypothetical protein [Candidatus Gracilibacteria bacterium]
MREDEEQDLILLVESLQEVLGDEEQEVILVSTELIEGIIRDEEDEEDEERVVPVERVVPESSLFDIGRTKKVH